MTTNVHIYNEPISRPFGTLSVGDYFYYNGNLYIQTSGDCGNTRGDAVCLENGIKTHISLNAEVDLVTDIEILIK